VSLGDNRISTLDLITVTDDLDEVVEIMMKHRSWKLKQIEMAHSGSLP
jgi:hypothetical protein